MADRFWIKGGVNENWSTVGNWSVSTGGAGGASKPTSSDSVYFDANSFDGGGQGVTVDEAASCLDMDWTGATNTPTLAMTSNIEISGSLVFIAAMAYSGFSTIRMIGSNPATITTNGLAFRGYYIRNTGGVTLQDALTAVLISMDTTGTFDTNDQALTLTDWFFQGAGARTCSLGSSVITTVGWNADAVTNLTFNANTSTIKVTGTGVFTGAGLAYHHGELNGTEHTITGSNTFHSLAFRPAGAQTITFTDTTTQTVDACYRTGTGTITFQGSGAGGWAMTKTDQQRIVLNNMSISRSTVLPYNTWYAPPPVTDGSNNVNWTFQYPPMGAGWEFLRRRN